MTEKPPRSHFICEPDAEEPGWLRWRMADASRFNEAVLGRLIARAEGNDLCRVRMFPRVPLHSNNGGNVHGGVTLALIDISLFVAMKVLRDVDAGASSTVDLSTQFISAGDLAQPLDSVVEVLRETHRLGFLRGLVKQGDTVVASFTGTVRKPTSAPAS